METKLYTVAEAATQLGISSGAVRDAIARNRLTPLRFGGNGRRSGFILLSGEEITRYRAQFLGTRGTYRRSKSVRASSLDAESDAPRGDTPPRAMAHAGTENDVEERRRQMELGAAVGAALTNVDAFAAQLHHCTEAIVRHLDAAFARIWILNEPTATLELRASAGMYTHLDGGHARVRVGEFKIGRIAARRLPHLTNDVPDDPEVSDHEWARREGMVAFAGHPLLVEGRVVGVMAMFARHPLTEGTLTTLASVADQIALGVVRDALRLQAEEALADARAARARLEGIFMQVPAALCYLEGPDHVFTVANPMYLLLIGGARDIIGKSVAVALPEAVDQGFIELLDAVYTTGEPYIGTEMLVRLDRKGDGVLNDCYVNFVYLATRDAAGVIEGILVHAVEVTESVRARQQVEKLLSDVQEAELRYRELFAGVGESILVTDATGRYLDANPAMTALVGYSVEELRQMRVGDLSVGDDSPFVHEIHALPDGSRRGALLLRRKDGTSVPVEGWVTSVVMPSGTIYLGTWHDISDRIRADEERQQFIVMVAHELRNPLASLLGYAQLMYRRERYDARGLETIIAQAKRLERLTLDLRETALLEAGVPSIQRSRVDICALTHTAVEQVQTATTTHTILLDLPPVMPEAYWDSDRVLQVLSNLLLNAVKYSPEGTTVSVQVTDAGDVACIAIRDTGIGIPAEAIPRLFEPFFRAANARAGSARGLGVGLSISKGLIEAHGGTLTVASTLGEGSTFTITLPYLTSVDAPSTR